jgi:hypothetical protein
MQEVPTTVFTKVMQVIGAVLLTVLVMALFYWANLLPSLQLFPERKALRR